MATATKSGKGKAQLDKAAFLQALSAQNEACAEMDFSAQNWMPDPGTYQVQLTEVNVHPKEKDGETCYGIKPIFTILGPGADEGRSFSDFIWLTPGTSELTPALRQLLYFATCVAEREIRDAREAFQVVEQAKGEFLEVQVVETQGRGKNAGRTFTNIRYTSKLASEAAE